jgi:hypothetical protein
MSLLGNPLPALLLRDELGNDLELLSLKLLLNGLMLP